MEEEKMEVYPSVLDDHIWEAREQAFYGGMLLGTMYGMLVALVLGYQLRK